MLGIFFIRVTYMPKNSQVYGALTTFIDAANQLREKQNPQIAQGLFSFKDIKVTKTVRQKANDRAVELLRQIEQQGQDIPLTLEQKEILSKYTGKGGNLEVEGKKGSQYEYYTPKPLADQMWTLLSEMGFDGGLVLDPSAGTGIFAAGRPENVVMQSVELNDVSGKVNALVNDQDNHNVIVSPFEKVAAQTADNTYDAIITNVPFGSNADRGANPQYDIYDKDPLDSYFVKRAIDKLKYGKLAVFIAHTKLMTGASFSKFRHQISLKAELVGAYRLPNSIFHSTGADVVTDLLVYRKHTEEMTQKIEQFYENGQIQLLTDARVLDADIISGKYFKTEGKLNVLGEVTLVPNFRNKAKDIEAVINNDGLPNILKLIKRFPDSRINFEALEVAEVPQSAPIQEGDVRVMAGTTFEYQDGKWIPSKTIARFEREADFETPYHAYTARLKHDDLMQMVGYCQSAGKGLPEWVEKLNNVLSEPKQSAHFQYWLTVLATKYVLDNTSRIHNYAEAFPELTSGMITYASAVNAGKPTHNLFKTELRQAKIAFDKNGNNGLSDHWYGKSVDLDIQLNARSAYENAIYKGRANDWMVDIDTIKQSDPNFDPFTNDEYAINADGTKVSLNRDYYVGNHGELLAKLDEQIKNATDPAIRGKLLKQREKSFEYTNTFDVTKLDFGIRATNIDLNIKQQFLSAYGGSEVTFDENGRLKIQNKAGSLDSILRLFKADAAKAIENTDVKAFFLNRVIASLNNGSNYSLQANKDKISQKNHDLIYGALLKYVKELDSTFNAYLKSDIDFMDGLNQKINDPSNKDMVTELDDSAIEINGFSPKLETFEGLNNYQNEEVRRLTRKFEGIMGFDVGLGKTMTSIATTQALHNIGIKKRTMFVVPSHTISKWYKDMKMCLDNVDDVLVIGSDENKLDSVKSSNYAKDLNLLLSKPYRKIIITSDAFTLIPLKDQTIMDFYGFKLDGIDKDKQIQAAEAFIAKKAEILQENKGNQAYFEDLNIDSIVFDEAQMFKNGDAPEGNSNFTRVAGLSLLAEGSLSNRAISAKVKSWYVRDHNDTNDGVILLSATPITNSPTEIMTMLSLSVGDEKARRMLGGATIGGVDDFLSTFVNTEIVAAKNITGGDVSAETFTGFKNASLLKSALHSIANIQTAKERGLKIPDQEDVKIQIDLPESEKSVLNMMKYAYNTARQMQSGGMGVDADALATLDQISEMLGEPHELIASPFNLISKMSDVILMGEDIAFSRSLSVSIQESDMALAEKVADAFNDKKVKIETERKYPFAPESDVKVKKIAKNYGDKNLYEVTARAFIEQDKNVLRLTVHDSKAIAVLFDIAEKYKLNLKPKLSAKVQACLENFKQEWAAPKHNGKAKQIIFCDTISMHHILKKALVEYCGVPKSKIAILNAQTLPDGKVGSPKSDDVQKIQDSFANDEYLVVIANKKADTGIDLQNGTQAVHHLTTGWTPDSLQQRNGRAIRQGNKQKSVNVYMYNANGTFDEYKTQVINGKSDWIDNLMSKNEEVVGTLKVAGGLSEDDYDLMIQADSPEKVTEILKQRAITEQKNRRDRSVKQTELLSNIAKKAKENADITQSKVLEKIMIEDYKRYAMLIIKDNKAETAEERQEILQQKMDLIIPYDAIFSNNLVINWDKGLSSAVNTKRVDYIGIHSMHFSNFGMDSAQFNEKVKGIQENQKGELFKRAKNRYDSIQRMAETSMKQYMDYADSPFTKEEKQALFDGKGRIQEDGTVIKTGDLCQGILNNGIIYGVYEVEKGAMSRPRFTTTSWSGITDVKPLDPQDRHLAMNAFVEFEKSEITKLNVFKYDSLSTGHKREICRFSPYYPEVQEAVEKKLVESQDQWINEDSKIRVRLIKLKEERIHYWHESILEDLYSDNPEIVKVFNQKFEGLIKAVELDSDGVACLIIPNSKMDHFVKDHLRTDSIMFDDIVYEAQKNDLKLTLSSLYPIALTYYNDQRNQLAHQIKLQEDDHTVRLYDFETILTVDQKKEIAIWILNKAFSNITNPEVFLDHILENALFKGLLKKYAIDASSNEGLVKKLTKLYTNVGFYKKQKITGVAFIGTGDFGTQYRFNYKELAKDYADSIGKKCIWDGAEKRWIVPPEVMLWIMQQDWFNKDEIEYFE